MTDLALWFSPGACSFAPHALLHEIQIPYKAIEVSVLKGENMSKEFARINPKKRVPVLSLNGELITEVPAIVTAIADLAPEKQLMGKDGLERVRVYEWMNWLSGALHGQGFGGLWRPERFSDDPETFDSIRARATKTISDCFTVIDGKLSNSHSVTGDFSAVDPYLLVFYRWGNGIGTNMKKEYPVYTRFAKNLIQRESIIAAFAAEGIDKQLLFDSVPILHDGKKV